MTKKKGQLDINFYIVVLLVFGFVSFVGGLWAGINVGSAQHPIENSVNYCDANITITHTDKGPGSQHGNEVREIVNVKSDCNKNCKN